MLSARRRKHLEMATLASALPQCFLLPVSFEGGLLQNLIHKVTLGLQGAPRAQLLAVGQDIGGHCALP